MNADYDHYTVYNDQCPLSNSPTQVSVPGSSRRLIAPKSTLVGSLIGINVADGFQEPVFSLGLFVLSRDPLLLDVLRG